MNIQFSIDGAKELDQLLKELGEEPARKSLESAMRKGANVLKDAARAKAPVYQGEVTIRSGQGKTGKRALIPRLLQQSIVVKKIKKTASSVQLAVVVLKRAFYGRFLEFGTRFISARPFFRPAFDETREAVLSTIANDLKKNIEREAKRLAGQLGTRRRKR